MTPRTIATFILFFFLLMHSVKAQQSITGLVVDADNKALPFVSVALLRDTSFIRATVSGKDGSFQLPVDAAGTYSVKCTLVGYSPLEQSFSWPATGQLKLVMRRDEKTLKEVVVESRRPLITRQADRYVMNVENSYLANGNSALEVLKQTPGLWVTTDDQIRISGSQGVMVMINDVVQRMSGDELANFLRSLRSEDISKIEVIPNPPAEFEASATGGIVHIVLKRTRKEGLTGTVYAQYRQQGKDPYTAEGISMDLKLKKIYLFGSFAYNLDKSRYDGHTYTTYPDQSRLANQTNRFNDNTRKQYRFGAAWDFSSRQSFNVQFIGAAGNLDQRFESAIDYDQNANPFSGTALSLWKRTPWQGSGTANYTFRIDSLGSMLKLIADYTRSDKDEDNLLISEYSDPSKDRQTQTLTPATTDILSVSADYTKALRNKETLRGGLKYVSTGRNNTVNASKYSGGAWVKDIPGSNEFVYDERLMMGYATWERSINKTSIRAGLRGEMTWSKGVSVTSGEKIEKNYFSLFPSIFLSQMIDQKKGNWFSFSWSRRVRRPGYNDLNPYRLQVHDFTILTGNPDLVPQYTHSFRAGYVYHENFSADVYYQATHNFIAQTASTIDTNIILYRAKNFPHSTEYGISLNSTFTVKKIWEIRPALSVNRNLANFDSVHVNQIYANASLTQTLLLKKLFDFDLTFWYNSPYYISEAAKQVAVFSTNIGITKKIMKGKFRIRLSANDLFNQEKEQNITRYKYTTIDFYQKRPTRVFGCTLTWNFKAGKEFVKKKIDVENSEEKSRL